MRVGILILGVVFLIIGGILGAVGANDISTIQSYGVLGTLSSNYQSAMASAQMFEIIGIVIAIIGIVLIIVGAIGKTKKAKARESEPYNESLKTLNERLVNGEITEKEYKNMKKRLAK